MAQNKKKQPGIDPKQKLEAKDVKNPPRGTLERTFHLSKKSKAGGYIVQEITITTIFNVPSHWWEAWEVKKGSQDTKLHENGFAYDDKFRDPAGMTVRGSARFYEGLVLPVTFYPGSPRTAAGILPATAIDPNLPTTNATAPVDITWTAP